MSDPDSTTGALRRVPWAGIVAGLAIAVYFRTALVPIAFGVVLYCLLKPLADRLAARGLPLAWASGVLVTAFGAVAVGLAFAAYPALDRWIGELPTAVAAAGERLRGLMGELRRAAEASGIDAGEAGSDPPLPVAETVKVLWTFTSAAAAAVATALLTAFMMLASSDMFARKAAKLLPPHVAEQSFEAAGAARAAVRDYLRASALLSAGQAALLALGLQALGMPQAWLWGVAAFFAEFVPYLGGLLLTFALGAASLAAQDNIVNALAAPGLFAMLSAIQNNVASPIIYGKHLRVTAFATFAAVLAGSAIWGVAGAFLAVPLLAAARAAAEVCRHQALVEALTD